MKLNAICELFDSPVPIMWKKHEPSNWLGSFNVNGKEYALRMVTMITMDQAEFMFPDFTRSQHESDMWEVSFDLIQNGRHIQSITGSGDAPTVFATVLYGIRIWLGEVKPYSFALSAREPNRRRLYSRLLRMLPKQWSVKNYGETFVIKDTSKILQKVPNDDYGDHDDHDDYGDYDDYDDHDDYGDDESIF